MTFAEYTRRLKICFKWQYRWGVFTSDVREHADSLVSALWGILAGVISVVLLVVWPILLVVSLLYNFSLGVFLAPLKISQDIANEMERTIKQREHDS